MNWIEPFLCRGLFWVYICSPQPGQHNSGVTRRGCGRWSQPVSSQYFWYTSWFRASATKQMRTLLGCYAASSGNFLPTFRNNLSVTSSRVKNSRSAFNSWLLKMGQAVCPETSVRNHHYSLRNRPEERSSVPHFTLFSLRILYLLTYLLTYSLTYSLTYLPTYLLTYSLTYSFIYLITYLLTYLITYLRTYLLPYLLTHLLT